MQDFYAHNVKYNGKYVDSRSDPIIRGHYFANGKIQEGWVMGMSGDYIDNAYLEACKANYPNKTKVGKKVHAITADNINADFVRENGKYKWVWINDKNNNPRYKNAMDDTIRFLEEFIIWTRKQHW